MPLNKQIKLYSIDTAFFYNPEELVIHNEMNRLYIYRKKLESLRSMTKRNEFRGKLSSKLKILNKKIKLLKSRIVLKFEENVGIRSLNAYMLSDKKVVAMFESSLTRLMGLRQNQFTEDVMIVQTYFLKILEDIILDGFMYKGEKYVCFTASAGQIRNKKTLFIKESVLNKLKPSLMCGLTADRINAMGGININKYLAYLALCSSATDIWEKFNIKRSIVVDDMETTVRGIVDFICDKTYEIERKEMDIPINQTDGVGMVLPRRSKKNFMIRLPWIKGLLVSFPFDNFIKKYGGSKVKDIYGKEHDILKENIEVIFTKSQFKMYQYYESWMEYVSYFIKNGCQAGICNEEEDNFEDAKINYQMLQTLTDISDDEILELVSETNKNISSIGKERGTMFRVLGVTKANTNKNNLQKALELYPELIQYSSCRKILKQTKKKLVKEGRAGKLFIDGKYTFLSPDLFAFCEYLFLGNKDPNGLLKNNQVYCNLYKKEPKLDCLRSPHLYREHAIRDNVVDDEKSGWFVTDALYVSCHDLISKIIMCDFDGDRSLVVADKTIIDVAERNMKGIVPLYYNMAKAGKMELSHQSIYYGLKTAYTGANIGIISNDITKIWNSDNINLDVIKLLCLENNFAIDYAKTLYKPERPLNKQDMISDYTKLKTPYFFIYAKDKSLDKVEPFNNSVVNRINKAIINPKISFRKAGIDKFNYKMLKKDKDLSLELVDNSLSNSIISIYTELDLKKRFITIDSQPRNTQDNILVYENIRNKILTGHLDPHFVTDVLVEYLFGIKKSNHITTLLSCFGDIIVENLKNNILANNFIYCKSCGDIIPRKSNRQTYCHSCWKEIRNGKQRELMQKLRNC